MGYGFAFEAELQAATYVISCAWEKEWLSSWLESDSMYVVRLFHFRDNWVPWHLLAK